MLYPAMKTNLQVTIKDNSLVRIEGLVLKTKG